MSADQNGISNAAVARNLAQQLSRGKCRNYILIKGDSLMELQDAADNAIGELYWPVGGPIAFKDVIVQAMVK